MGKNLRSSVAGANNTAGPGTTKLIGQLSDRVSLLEKRYSRVMIHQTYFKLLDEWLQRMFGMELFPQPKDMEKSTDAEMDEDTENPFYELHMLHQRVNVMEDELQSMGIDIPQIKPKYTKSVAPKPVQRKSYGQSPSIRRRSITTTSAKPPVLKPSAVPSKSQKANDSKNDEAVVKEKSEGKETGGEEGKTSEDDTEKPPILEEIKAEPDDDGDEELEEVPDPNIEEKSAPGSNEISDAEKMEVDEEYMEEDEDFDQKPDLEDLDYEVARYTKKKLRETPGRKKGSNNGGKEEEALDEEPEQPVTYTTRGRRHTLPRRYAEFTGHDNVASILKSQQRAAGSNPAKNKRFIEKQKSPLKPKPVPKLSTPKKADGSRPECVYKLIGDVQGKEVDDDGCVILWDPIPNVKVNQQQLISVIFRSNGMATRLTRKLTTLVFEDQVLANTSPFGTKYYSERLPPEPLEAMVEFISSSGFDADYTKKKIYMVVGQVCNEARAGRVRKLLPSSSGSAAATESEAPLAAESTSSNAPS